MLENFNPDNTVVLRGRVAQDDFSKQYRVLKDGKTTAQIMFAVHNPKRNVADFIPIRLYGHVIDDEHKHGGMLEKFLSVASVKNTICVYCHVSPFDYEYNMRGKGKRKVIVCSLVVDTFRADGNIHDMEKFMKTGKEQNGLSGLSQKYHRHENIDLSRNKADFKMNDEISKTIEKSCQNVKEVPIQVDFDSAMKDLENTLEKTFKKYIGE